MPPEIDLFAAPRGSVTAPAGCGKTQLIADTLALHQGSKPILVLTHTNAGVNALKQRMQKAQIPKASYRIATIDGFAIKLIRNFPMRSGHDHRILELVTPNNDYPAIRNAAARLLQSGHLNEVVSASYERLIVDEYQDCNQAQHAVVTWLATRIPTYVLGDPMQAIFGFRGNPLVDWDTEVLAHFPSIGELKTPWRWRQAETVAFGAWLLEVRQALQAGQDVDLSNAPPEVQWVQTTPALEHQQRLNAAGTVAPENGSVLVIGDAINVQSRHDICSQTPGSTVVESVDFKDFIGFAAVFNPENANALQHLVNFAGSVMTQVGAGQFVTRAQTIQAGRHRNEPTVVESAAVEFLNTPSLVGAEKLLRLLAAQQNARVYRPEVYSSCLSALHMAATGAVTFHEAAVQVRERKRHVGRPITRRSVGSTLLLKGLESHVAVILKPEVMTAQNLYVAMTRGSKKLVICSAVPVLRPAR